MKDTLQKYQENTLSTSDTERLEKQIVQSLVDNEQRQKWKKLLAEKGVVRTPKTVHKLSVWRYAMGVAATVLIAAALWFTMGERSDLSANQLTDKYMSEQFANPSTRDAKDELSEWTAAKQAYAKRDFSAVIKNLDGLGGPNTEQIFYKSLAYMYQTPPDLDKSAVGFVQLLKKNENFADEAQWFYILISLKKGEKEAAMSMLENVIGKRNIYSEKAKILLEQLK
ncbi:MAG: hypothetical protein U5L45_05940 [Saprospiraceae bacterium]|nr:hypothetical protein [Saprospiraceae bacterium]